MPNEETDEQNTETSKTGALSGRFAVVLALLGAALIIFSGNGPSMPYIEGHGGNQNPLVGIPNAAMSLVGMALAFVVFKTGQLMLVISAISTAIWVATNNNKTKNYVALGVVAMAVGIAGFGNVFEFSKKTAPMYLQPGYYPANPWMGICSAKYTRKGLDVFSYGNRQKAFEGHSVAGVSQGLHTGWYENGQKSFEVNCVDGKNEGLEVGWYENGQKSVEHNVLKGEYGSPYEGLMQEWHENGQMSSETKLANGQSISYIAWHPNGQKAAEKTHGQEASEYLFTEWHDNGQLKSQGIFLRGGGPGNGTVTTWHANGIKATEVHYDGITDDPGVVPSAIKNGFETSWFKNGQKKYESSYVKGRLDGAQTGWYENGRMRIEKHFVNGQSSGTKKDWYEIGQMKSQMTYSDDYVVGVWTTWHANGQKSFQEEGISRETPKGTLRQRWDRSGTLTERIKFDEYGQTEEREYWDSDGQPKSGP